MKRVTKTTPVSFRMGISEKRQLDSYCDETNQHMSSIIRDAVVEYLEYIKQNPIVQSL